MQQELAASATGAGLCGRFPVAIRLPAVATQHYAAACPRLVASRGRQRLGVVHQAVPGEYLWFPAPSAAVCVPTADNARPTLVPQPAANYIGRL
jgi:hypothetical protein